jgi:hypothetical protein
MFRWLLRAFCKHSNATWWRNIYGDEVNACGGNRSMWHCPDCHDFVYRRELHRTAEIQRSAVADV